LNQKGNSYQYIKSIGLVSLLVLSAVLLTWAKNPEVGSFVYNSLSDINIQLADFQTSEPQKLEADSPSKSIISPDSNQVKLKYPIKQDENNPYSKVKSNSLDLKNPNAVENSKELDSSGKFYNKTSKVGSEEVGSEKVSFDENSKEENKEFIKDYFKKRSLSQSNIIKASPNVVPNVLKTDGLFGDFMGGLIDIRPTGSAELIFGLDVNRIANPNWSLREQRSTQFKFDQKIQMNVIGNIGNRIKLGINYNTETSFDFQNQRKLNYTGQEDEIVKSIELGNVSMPISNSLITGSSSLFGVKTRLQFGKLFVDGVYAQNQGERKEIVVENGAQKTQFNITADNYDVNKNFLIAHYFRDNYNRFNKNYPALSSIVITRVNVWVTNSQNTIANSRTVVALMDLGEGQPYNNTIITGNPGALPDNNANTLYNKLLSDSKFRDNATAADELDHLRNQNFLAGQDYVKIDNARLLQSTEYTLNQRLGYISLNFQPRPNDVIGIAFEYTYNGQKYTVGEIAQDQPPNPSKPNVLFVKMLKSNITYTRLPIWDLMMKNIYNLNAYQVSPTDFKLQVIYEDNQSGSFLNYIPAPSEKTIDGKPLIQVLSMDRFNSLGELKPDGNFDFLEGVTITNNGKVIFPVLEPFGTDLSAKFVDKTVAANYTYDSLYRSTRAVAIQQTNRNKFYLRGSYQGSSGSEISLNAINVPQGSVKVYAGGQELRENIDFTVDYGVGRVKIINPSIIASGSVIRVSLESQSLFNIQQKTLIGGRAEYKFSKDFYLGATLMYLRERPLTPKVNVGDEPIRNTIYGFDGSWSKESPFLTKLVNKLPFTNTKEKSSIFAKGEFAEIIPGHPKLINDPGDPNSTGLSYLDDFEAAEVPYDLRLGNYWVLSSTPEGVSKFPEANLSNDLSYGFNRAKLSWYTIDPIFFRNNSNTPAHIQADKKLQSNQYMREVLETEVFPNKQLPSGVPGTLTTFDLSFWPNQRGPYNYNYKDLNFDGTLTNPQNKWAGIMRRIETSDFEAANIQYIEFWLLDPFMYRPNQKGGDLTIQLGNLSEDILKDRQKSYENGLPKTGLVQNVDTTAWGRVSTLQQINSAFETDATARGYQDVGFDGLGPVGTDDDERSFFQKTYLDKIEAKHGKNSKAFAQAEGDPSNDNFHFYTGTDFDNAKADIIQRYKRYNNNQGNTPIASNNQTNGYGTPNPDDEDINRDFTLNTVPEQYFEYKIKITPEALTKNVPNARNFCTTVLPQRVTLRDNTVADVTWYQFKIPVNEFTRRYGTIQDFRSIQYMRLYVDGWDDSTTLRFGQLQLVRGEWRPYLFNLIKPGEYIPVDDKNTSFVLSSVNLERNGNRQGKPPYVVPPGIQRTIDVTTPDQIQQNEQSLSMRVCNLQDGDARAVFKNTNFDIRLYKKLKMFCHAEGDVLKDNDATVFIRIGTDLNSNFYEYEMPLKVTPYSSRTKEGIWPSANNMLITLADLYNTKQQRNLDRSSLLIPYIRQSGDGVGKITVLGNPDLSNIKTILIGIRNPKNELNPDGKSICGEFWVNELRVTDFDEQGGWAANGTVRAKLADLAVLTFSGQRKTIGFGTIEQTVQQRSQKDVLGLDFSAAVNLDKLFPKSFNLKIPFYYSLGILRNNPRFYPLAPDLPFQSTIDAYGGNDSVIKANQDFTRRRTVGFNNVQKLRSQSKKRSFPWDISNFNFTYTFGEVYKRNIERVYDVDQNSKGIINYTYTFPASSVDPFKKLGQKNASKYFKLITDFNFYYLPQSWSFSFEGNRRYSEILYRNTDAYKSIITPQFDKNFKLNRTYNLRYNLTKSLRYSYSASAYSFVPEPEGRLDTKEKQNQFWDSLKTLGKLNNFNQRHELNYDVPISKLPYLDWTTLQTGYQGTYSWQKAFPATPQYGNTISNSATITMNSTLNFLTLFNKSKFLKESIDGSNIKAKPSNPEEPKKVDPKKNFNSKKSTAAKEKENKKLADMQKAVDDSIRKAANGSRSGFTKLMNVGVRILTSLRTINLSYTQSNGMALPGFLPTPKYIGLSSGEDNPSFANAPGVPFVLGFQHDIRAKAKQNGWITRDTNLSSLYLTTYNSNFNGTANFEPFKNFRITLTATRKESMTSSESFRFRGNSNEPQSFGGVTTGNYSISILPISTSFSGSSAYQRFEQDYRKPVAFRLAEGNTQSQNKTLDSTGFPKGYRRNSQDVLMYAFLAAYQGKDPNKINLNPFPTIPMPNWNLTYNGLAQMKPFKKYTKNITITHGYRSTYNVGSFISSLNYSNLDTVALAGKSLRPKYVIDNVSITEDFSPLLGIDIQWISGLTTKIEYRKARNVSIAFTNYQVNETRTEDITFGAGYRTNKLLLPFKVNRKKMYLKNDLTAKLDITYRNNINEVRVIDQGTTQNSAGNRVISIKPNIQYQISKSLLFTFFWTSTITTPYVSTQYPTSNTSAGFTLRYTLTP